MFVDQLDQIYSDDSSESVEEVEPPQKLPPPLIDLTLDDTISNPNSTSVRARNPNDKAPAPNVEIPGPGDENSPSHWTDDMVKFYNEEWGGEAQFNVERIQSTMDKDPSLWQISSKDLLFRRNRRTRSYVKCINCCQFGHSIFQCKEGMQLPKCHMCGWPGHEEPTCPRAVCLTCGNPTSVYVMSCVKCIPEAKTTCTNCYLHGHHLINCSDNWRRFHATVGKITVEVPQNRVYKTPKELWCCNCGRKGHNQVNCRTRECSFPDTFPYVVTYNSPFKQSIYNLRQGPDEGTSTSGMGDYDHTQTLGNRRFDSRWMRHLNKASQKKRKRRKKKNSALMRMFGLIHCE